MEITRGKNKRVHVVKLMGECISGKYFLTSDALLQHVKGIVKVAFGLLVTTFNRRLRMVLCTCLDYPINSLQCM